MLTQDGHKNMPYPRSPKNNQQVLTNCVFIKAQRDCRWGNWGWASGKCPPAELSSAALPSAPLHAFFRPGVLQPHLPVYRSADAQARSRGHTPPPLTLPGFPESCHLEQGECTSALRQCPWCSSPSHNQNVFWLKGGEFQADKARCNFVCCVHACHYGMTSSCGAEWGLLQRFWSTGQSAAKHAKSLSCGSGKAPSSRADRAEFSAPASPWLGWIPAAQFCPGLEPWAGFLGKSNRNCVANSKKRESFQSLCSSHQSWWMIWVEPGQEQESQDSPLLGTWQDEWLPAYAGLCVPALIRVPETVFEAPSHLGEDGLFSCSSTKTGCSEEWVTQETLGSCHLEERSGRGQALTSPLLCGLHFQ